MTHDDTMMMTRGEWIPSIGRKVLIFEVIANFNSNEEILRWEIFVDGEKCKSVSIPVLSSNKPSCKVFVSLDMIASDIALAFSLENAVSTLAKAQSFMILKLESDRVDDKINETDIPSWIKRRSSGSDPCNIWLLPTKQSSPSLSMPHPHAKHVFIGSCQLQVSASMKMTRGYIRPHNLTPHIDNEWNRNDSLKQDTLRRTFCQALTHGASFEPAIELASTMEIRSLVKALPAIIDSLRGFFSQNEIKSWQMFFATRQELLVFMILMFSKVCEDEFYDNPLFVEPLMDDLALSMNKVMSLGLHQIILDILIKLPQEMLNTSKSRSLILALCCLSRCTYSIAPNDSKTAELFLQTVLTVMKCSVNDAWTSLSKLFPMCLIVVDKSVIARELCALIQKTIKFVESDDSEIDFYLDNLAFVYLNIASAQHMPWVANVKPAKVRWVQVQALEASVQLLNYAVKFCMTKSPYSDGLDVLLASIHSIIVESTKSGDNDAARILEYMWEPMRWLIDATCKARAPVAILLMSYLELYATTQISDNLKTKSSGHSVLQLSLLRMKSAAAESTIKHLSETMGIYLNTDEGTPEGKIKIVGTIQQVAEQALDVMVRIARPFEHQGRSMWASFLNHVCPRLHLFHDKNHVKVLTKLSGLITATLQPQGSTASESPTEAEVERVLWFLCPVVDALVRASASSNLYVSSVAIKLQSRLLKHALSRFVIVDELKVQILTLALSFDIEQQHSLNHWVVRLGDGLDDESLVEVLLKLRSLGVLIAKSHGIHVNASAVELLVGSSLSHTRSPMILSPSSVRLRDIMYSSSSWQRVLGIALELQRRSLGVADIYSHIVALQLDTALALCHPLSESGRDQLLSHLKILLDLVRSQNIPFSLETFLLVSRCVCDIEPIVHQDLTTFWKPLYHRFSDHFGPFKLDIARRTSLNRRLIVFDCTNGTWTLPPFCATPSDCSQAAEHLATQELTSNYDIKLPTEIWNKEMTRTLYLYPAYVIDGVFQVFVNTEDGMEVITLTPDLDATIDKDYRRPQSVDIIEFVALPLKVSTRKTISESRASQCILRNSLRLLHLYVQYYAAVSEELDGRQVKEWMADMMTGEILDVLDHRIMGKLRIAAEASSDTVELAKKWYHQVHAAVELLKADGNDNPHVRRIQALVG